MCASHEMRRSLVLCGLLLISMPAAAEEIVQPAASGTTLREAFAYALKHSERIIISEQVVRQAEALYHQALGDSLPKASYVIDNSFEDGADSEHDGAFRISQEGLNGYRQLAAIRTGKSTVKQRRFERLRAEQLLLADIAIAFYGWLQANADVISTDRLAGLSGARLTELTERVRVGRTRSADAIGQEFQITNLHSQLEELQRLADARANLLTFLVGKPVIDPVLTEPSNAAAQPALEEYLQRLGRRPDVRAAEESVAAGRRLVDLERADYLPELDLSANYYTHRPKASEATDWTVSLSVDVPIWAWGERRAGVAAAKAVLRQRDEMLRAIRRQAEFEIRTAHRDYVAARRQLDFRQRAVELARKNYELQLTDDRQGLVTSLEVFESLDRLNAAELAFNSAQLQERLAALNLEIVSGATPDEALR